MTARPRFLLLLWAVLLAVGFSPAACLGEPNHLVLTKANEHDLDLNWQTAPGSEAQVNRSLNKNMVFGQTVARTSGTSYRDPYILDTYRLYFYEVEEFDCSKPTQSLVRGRVLCKDTGDPKAGCEVELKVTCEGKDPVVYTASTDVNGLYEVCIVCPDCSQWTLRVQACCGDVREVPVVDCPPAISVPNIECLCGNDGPCVDPGQTFVKGRVICADTGLPMASCEVAVEVKGCPDVPPATYAVVTDAQGYYELCVECPGCDRWIIFAKARCCDAATDPRVEGCPGEFLMPDIKCNGCGDPRPCGVEKTQVSGLVKCPDTGAPKADCEVTVEVKCGLDTWTYTAVTNADGRYTVCVDCSCNPMTVVAKALCCDAITDARVEGCPAEYAMPDLVCATCADSRPCGVEKTQVSGLVKCPDTGAPKADCEVTVEVKCGLDTWTYTAVTNADGRYTVCVDCSCNPMTVVAKALCCDAIADARVEGCPAEYAMPDLVCASCP